MSKTSIALNDDELQIVKRFAAAANQTQSEYIRDCIFKRIKSPAPAPQSTLEIESLRESVQALAGAQRESASALASAIRETTRQPSFREWRARATAEGWRMASDNTDALIELARSYYNQYRRWPDPDDKKAFGGTEGFEMPRYRSAIRS